jgi:hypothetical protein
LIITLAANFQGEKRQGEGTISDLGFGIADFVDWLIRELVSSLKAFKPSIPEISLNRVL